MKTRAAILWQLNKPLIIDDVQIPALKRGQILVKIYYSGLCRAQYNEMIGLKGPDRFLPHLLGHEASGVIVEIGAGVRKVKNGDYVCLSWIKGLGLDGINSAYLWRGHSVNAGAVTTFSDFAVVSENRVTRIPKAIPPKLAAIVGCAIVTGCGIMDNTLSVLRGSSLAVFGAGGIGSSVILGARRRGCKNIIAVDIGPAKLKFAKRVGATHTIDGTRKDVLKDIFAITGQGVDYAVDASGNKVAMETAFSSIKTKGGVCVIAGNLSKEEKISFHPFDLIQGKRIMGTWGGESKPDQDIPRYVRAYLRGTLPMDVLITHEYALENINQAFGVLVKGQAGRIVIKMNNSPLK
jgi:S-(hydroxymethyl)glutathione dehydrogenase / alcohol dehydrogenase